VVFGLDMHFFGRNLKKKNKGQGKAIKSVASLALRSRRRQSGSAFRPCFCVTRERFALPARQTLYLRFTAGRLRVSIGSPLRMSLSWWLSWAAGRQDRRFPLRGRDRMGHTGSAGVFCGCVMLGERGTTTCNAKSARWNVSSHPFAVRLRRMVATATWKCGCGVMS